MPFWPVVLLSLIGVPCVLLASGMGMVFAAAGLAGGPQEARAKGIVRGWFALAWVLVSVFFAFGVAPAWRAWHGGEEHFAGGLQALVDWLVGVGAVGLVGAGVLRAIDAAGAAGPARSPLARLGRGLALTLIMAPWGAIGGWLVWPLVLWPVQGHVEWPDAATGWTHAGEITLALLAASWLEDAVRRRRQRTGPSEGS